MMKTMGGFWLKAHKPSTTGKTPNYKETQIASYNALIKPVQRKQQANNNVRIVLNDRPVTPSEEGQSQG